MAAMLIGHIYIFQCNILNIYFGTNHNMLYKTKITKILFRHQQVPYGNTESKYLVKLKYNLKLIYRKAWDVERIIQLNIYWIKIYKILTRNQIKDTFYIKTNNIALQATKKTKLHSVQYRLINILFAMCFLCIFNTLL